VKQITERKAIKAQGVMRITSKSMFVLPKINCCDFCCSFSLGKKKLKYFQHAEFVDELRI
jgi:hypothetical protein